MAHTARQTPQSTRHWEVTSELQNILGMHGMPQELYVTAVGTETPNNGP